MKKAISPPFFVKSRKIIVDSANVFSIPFRSSFVLAATFDLEDIKHSVRVRRKLSAIFLSSLSSFPHVLLPRQPSILSESDVGQVNLRQKALKIC